MTFEEKVNQFVSDAAYRVGEIGMQMDKLADDSNYQYQNIKKMRRQLSNFLAILRHTTMSISDGTNFMHWDEYDILREMEYLRKVCGMSTYPIINFLNYAPAVIFGGGSSSGGGGGSGAGFPIGSPGDTIFYNISGQPYAEAISPYAGMGSDSINDYFADRP